MLAPSFLSNRQIVPFILSACGIKYEHLLKMQLLQLHRATRYICGIPIDILRITSTLTLHLPLIVHDTSPYYALSNRPQSRLPLKPELNLICSSRRANSVPLLTNSLPVLLILTDRYIPICTTCRDVYLPIPTIPTYSKAQCNWLCVAFVRFVNLAPRMAGSWQVKWKIRQQWPHLVAQTWWFGRWSQGWQRNDVNCDRSYSHSYGFHSKTH